MTKARPAIAVVLFNLGGPDEPRAVRPFLENLFSDPAIIRAPSVVRRPLAAFIARVRERSAIANYAVMGGASPILAQTRAQAQALELRLQQTLAGAEVKVFVAMRYWSPTTAQAAEAVRQFNPDQEVLAPLYPHYSTTTSASEGRHSSPGSTSHAPSSNSSRTTSRTTSSTTTTASQRGRRSNMRLPADSES